MKRKRPPVDQKDRSTLENILAGKEPLPDESEWKENVKVLANGDAKAKKGFWNAAYQAGMSPGFAIKTRDFIREQGKRGEEGIVSATTDDNGDTQIVRILFKDKVSGALVEADIEKISQTLLNKVRMLAKMYEKRALFGQPEACENLALNLMATPPSQRAILDSIIKKHVESQKPIKEAKALLGVVRSGKGDPSILEEDNDDKDIKL